MAQSISVLALTVIASAAITADRFVTDLGALPTTKGAVAGVARQSASIGYPFTVDVLGTAIVEAGEAIAKGDFLSTDASGKAVVATDGVKVAVALQAASASGKKIEVRLLSNA